jgi:SanA protein
MRLCLNLSKRPFDSPLAIRFLGVILLIMSPWLKKSLKAVFGFLGLFLLVSNLWIWGAGWGRVATYPSKVPAQSVMVLLGTDEFVHGTGEVTGTYRPRIEAAAALCKSGKIRLVVTSGTAEHAYMMAYQLRQAGVTCPIVEDPYGWRTLDSVLRAKAYYPHDHIVFVSQGWHCVRAIWLADFEGLSASGYAASFGRGWRPYQAWVRDCFAKPKAVLDRLNGNPLQAAMPVDEGNHPHR